MNEANSEQLYEPGDNVDFSPWYPYYDAFRRTYPGVKMSVDEFSNKWALNVLKTAVDEPTEDVVMTRALVAIERDYILAGRPYYKVASNFVEPASRMRLGNFTMDMIGMPAGLTSVNIRLPGDTVIDKRDIVGMLAGMIGNRFFLSVQREGTHVGTSCVLGPQSLENFIATQVEEGIQGCLRLYMAIKFLADCPNPDLINYDVLSKYKNEWVSATPERRRCIEDKSRRRGKIGWNIGVSSFLIVNAPRLTDGSGSEPTGRHLHYAHIRTGHTHPVRCGTKKQNIKLMFFRPTVVRKDLPFKPADDGKTT